MAEVKLSDKVSQSENGALAGLWKKINKDLNLEAALDYMVGRYVNKNKTLAGLTRVKNVNRKTKNSLIRNITASEMTWKTFLDLIFNFLNVRRVDITVKLTMPNGDETIHTIAVNNADVINEQESNDDK